MDEKYKAEESAANASLIREYIGELFVAESAERVILTPGNLIGLSVLLSGFNARRLILSESEYYSPQHFPALETEAVPIKDFSKRVVAAKPDAVIVSLVSWRGRVLPVEKIFHEIKCRYSSGANAPLLIADYAHAGAIGFPPLASLGADIICGDLYKWITPPHYYGNLGFIWFEKEQLWRKAKQLFLPFFLAIADETEIPLKKARWVNTKELKKLLAWLRENKITRTSLLENYAANRALTENVARELNIVESIQSNILWVSKDKKCNPLVEVFRKSGLAWEPQGENDDLRLLARYESIVNKDDLKLYSIKDDFVAEKI